MKLLQEIFHRTRDLFLTNLYLEQLQQVHYIIENFLLNIDSINEEISFQLHLIDQDFGIDDLIQYDFFDFYLNMNSNLKQQFLFEIELLLEIK